MIEKIDRADKFFWDGYNNVGIGVVAIASVLNYSGSLTVPKALLVIPMIIHQPTLAHMAHKKVQSRGSAALATSWPKLFVNFNERFESCLPLSVNSIQLLVHLNYANLGQTIVRRDCLEIDKEFGQRAQKIEQAAQKISELLHESEEELYLNFRVHL
ncbi:three component ABC system middle component [Halomonas sp. 86]|uniref:three component ABC system middle component n=1 Tax=unclassified Halomonas TaxID=2609666 RepID=UPI0040344806